MADLLVVDNDARIAELVAWFLEKGGHSPRVVTSYAAARDALREQRFALMLADLELGTEDGRVELPLLEAEGLLPKTLIVSGYLDAEITEDLGRLASVIGTMSKPFEPAELLERVNELVASEPDASAAPPMVEVAGEEDASQLEDVVIRPAPAPEVSESPSMQPSSPEGEPVPDDDEWVEIVPEERVDSSDREGAG